MNFRKKGTVGGSGERKSKKRKGNAEIRIGEMGDEENTTRHDTMREWAYIARRRDEREERETEKRRA